MLVYGKSSDAPRNGVASAWIFCFAVASSMGLADQARGQAAAGAPAKRLAARPSAAKATAGKTAATAKPKAGSAPESAPSDANPATASTIVAVVNGQSISRTDLAAQCIDRYGESVLESLVNKHLILEACRQQNVKITAEDIEAEIDKIAQRFNLPKDRWLQLLKDERNITAEQYRRDIVWPTLALQRLSADRLQVSQEDLDREFESEYGDKVQVRMIALNSRAEAEKVLQEVKAKPDSFGMAAKQYSVDPNSAAARGLIPPIRHHMGADKIEQVCFALQPGEISEIVGEGNQFLIFQCEKPLPAAHISPQYKQTAYDRLKERIVDRKLRDEAGHRFAQLQSSAKVVNVLNDEQKRKENPNVAASINGVPITMDQLAEECVARHGVNVLDNEINNLLLQQALKAKQATVTSAEVQAEISLAAEMYGYMTSDNKPDTKRWLAEVTQTEGMKEATYIHDAVWPSVALKKLVEQNVEVSQDDLDKGFEANYGPRVEVLAIVLGNQRKAQEVWNMARGNLTPQFFGQLASEYSMEPVSKANLGEVPPIRRYSGQPKIEEEAFTLTKEDPLSAIVASGDKFIIMYFLGRTEPVVTKAADVKDELTRDIREKKLRMAMAQEFDRLKESAQIDNFLAGQSQAGTRQAAKSTAPKAPSASAAPAAGSTGQTKPAAGARPAHQSPQIVRPVSQKTKR